MDNTTKVLIAIQARSTSQRLPKKCFEPMGNKRVLDHVIEACRRSATYSNRYAYKKKYQITVALLIPEGDIIKRVFDHVDIIEGPEFDVLTRFGIAQNKYDADYICRITGDCPLIPPYVITKHISLAVMCEYDYVSNVDEACRLSLDGVDCEVMSKRMLNWLVANSTAPSEREHVTLLARQNPPRLGKTWLYSILF